MSEWQLKISEDEASKITNLLMILRREVERDLIQKRKPICSVESLNEGLKVFRGMEINKELIEKYFAEDKENDIE